MDTSFFSILQFALGTTLPIFLVLFLGMFLSSRGKLSEDFIRDANQIIYRIGLPLMLFITCATSSFELSANTGIIYAFAIMTFVVFFGSWMTTIALKCKSDLGVIVQGSFRGNLVILGLAFTASAFGNDGLALATLPVAFTVVIYNILSVYILDRGKGFKGTLVNIVKNPLIIAILLGWLFNISKIPMPDLVATTSNYVTQMVLPLALICIGASLSVKQLAHFDRAVVSANIWKLIISPLIACALGYYLNVSGDALMILFLLASSPTATVSFVMAQALGANSKLAAAIIAQTTFFALITVTVGLTLVAKIAY